MCTGALLASRIKNLYFGEFDTKFGACGSVYNLAESKKTNHKINVYSGLYAAESRALLKNFFEKIRKAEAAQKNQAEIFKLGGKGL
jgi:tRNA(adenine34) deaminase